MGYKDLQGVTSGNKVLQEVAGGYKGLQEVTGGTGRHKGLQVDTEGHYEPQRSGS